MGKLFSTATIFMDLISLACLTSCPLGLNERCEKIAGVISFTKPSRHDQKLKNKKESFGKEKEVPLQERRIMYLMSGCDDVELLLLAGLLKTKT